MQSQQKCQQHEFKIWGQFATGGLYGEYKCNMYISKVYTLRSELGTSKSTLVTYKDILQSFEEKKPHKIVYSMYIDKN